MSTQTLSDKELTTTDGEIQCPPPNPEIYRFDARLRVGPDSFNFVALSEKNLIPQGTHLKNTDWLFGVVVYTGIDTVFFD
jgi:phospholipid-translocating ATPase